jgi:hypothetical protein
LAWTVADHAGRDKPGRDELAIALAMRRGEQPGTVRHPRRRRQPTDLPPTFSHQRPGPDQPLGQTDMVRQSGVFIGNFDSCTNTLLLSDNGSHAVDKNSFQVSSQLTSAELTTSFKVHDFVSNSGFRFQRGHDLVRSWHAPPRSGQHSLRLRPGHARVSPISATCPRLAIASGTVSDGTTNFTPQAIQGVLDSGKNGQVLIGGTTCP